MIPDDKTVLDHASTQNAVGPLKTLECGRVAFSNITHLRSLGHYETNRGPAARCGLKGASQEGHRLDQRRGSREETEHETDEMYWENQ